MASFQDILNKPMDEIKPPNPLPVGQYLALIDGQAQITKKGKNNTDCAVFSLKLIQALPTVDQQQLLTALDGKSLQEVKLSHTLWLTDDAAHRAKQFLQDHLGIVGAANLADAISQAMGRQFIVTIGHYISSKEGEAPTVGMEIKSTAKA